MVNILLLVFRQMCVLCAMVQSLVISVTLMISPPSIPHRLSSGVVAEGGGHLDLMYCLCRKHLGIIATFAEKCYNYR